MFNWGKDSAAVAEKEAQVQAQVKVNLSELTNQTDEALSGLNDNGLPELEMTEPEKIRAEALKTVYMPQHQSDFDFEMRCRMMEQLGFRKFESSEEALEFFTGEKAPERYTNRDCYPYGWVYNHHTDKEYKWGNSSTNGCNWTMQQYCWKTKQGVMSIGPVDFLKQSVPTGVLLSMADMKQYKLINCFHAIAPIEAWKPGEPIDPIVFGTIWELPNNYGSHSDNSHRSNRWHSIDEGKEAHFFIAKW